MMDKFSYITSLLGEKARASMLWSLLDGRAYTATELSACADISRQSASNHLAKLLDAQIIAVEKQGRHRYYRLAGEEIAQVLESMASLIPKSLVKPTLPHPKPSGLTFARTCYDHLAGEISVKITDALIERQIIESNGREFEVTVSGTKWFKELGINVDELKPGKRSFAHKCLDWTERRHHLAGLLGHALLEHMLQNDWIRKKQFTREVFVTARGIQELNHRLKLSLKQLTF